MISVEEAKDIIYEHACALKPERVSLLEAAGKVLAKDIHAPVAIPAFPQSSMDGYALSWSGWQVNKKLHIKGELPAGSSETKTLDPSNAIRIFTGAAVPSGADTVVIQEKVKVEDGDLVIEDINLKPGSNVRPMGSEIREGELALPKHSLLSPAAIGFLAGMGLSELDIYPAPRISVIVTGKELQLPGKPLEHGQVYESNSFALVAALHQIHMNRIELTWVDDNLAQLVEKLKKALEVSDIVLLTGGISAGDYDFVLQATEACKISRLFYKVKQRPGKPLFFGKKERKLVFGLPGNPASVLTCFYQYVLPAIGQMTMTSIDLKTEMVPLAGSFQKAPGITHFLKGWYDGRYARPLDAQESYRLSSFARANCLIQLNEDETEGNEGQTVKIHLLPSN